MPSLIKNGIVSEDAWKLITLSTGDTPETVLLPVGPLLVPASVWHARRAELINREHEHGWPLGVWLTAEEGPEAIATDVDDFTVIAVEFSRYADGRGYSMRIACIATAGMKPAAMPQDIYETFKALTGKRA